MNSIMLIFIIALLIQNIIAKPFNEETLNDLNLKTLDDSSSSRSSNSRSFDVNESEIARENHERNEKQFKVNEDFYQKDVLQGKDDALRKGRVLIFRPLFVYNQQQKRKQQQTEAHRRKDTIKYLHSYDQIQPQSYNLQKPKQKHCFYY
ncbi:hypothetical protein PVAND_012600 [Polypedilum vanderplanki]|uniref:Uncharacterized protein n=1 Tax=Polypedilum vanderplanki TaxID=319348 RepID=A0A9J6CM03_POLVA|nr:hypothetical protein PVAND_012600 [Polypedilum vanderplanki]